MVLDLLEQLSAALPSAEEGVEILRQKLKTAKRLELRLTDRTKLSDDGYACGSFVLFTHICYLVTRRSFGTRTHYFPRGMGASIVPFGRDRKSSSLTTD